MDTLEQTLQRLAREREEADRRYNEALTALDKSIGARFDVPDPDWGFDEHQVAALNEAWNILPSQPPTTGVRGKLTAFVWGIVAPYLQRQLTFNSWVVDHLNRNLESSRAAHQKGGIDALPVAR